jgi:hypothetical protein
VPLICVTHRPNIRGNGCDLPLRKICATFRRHNARVVSRPRYAGRDRLRDRRQASVAPNIDAIAEAGPDRRAPGVRSMAAAASAVGRFAVEDALAERDLLPDRAGWRAQRLGGTAGVRMRSFGWLRRKSPRPRRRRAQASRRFAPYSDRPCRRRARSARARRRRYRARRPVHREARRSERGAARILMRPGESIRENRVVTRLLAIGHRLEDYVIAALRQRRAVPGLWNATKAPPR